MTTRWPSGEKLGEKVMPGKLPTASRWPVSRSSNVTFGSVSPNDMNATCCAEGEKRGATASLSPLVRYLTLAPSMSITARRLRRFSLEPLSSTNTTRESKKPFSPVMRENTASAMRWPTRRALAAVGGVLLAGDLRAGRGVPQAELRGDAAALGARHPAGQHELRVDRLPGVDVRPHVGIGHVFGKGWWD